jgi:hypothetical protein
VEPILYWGIMGCWLTGIATMCFGLFVVVGDIL